MKKIKELLLFLALLVIPIVLFFIISPFSAANMLSFRPDYIDIDNYIRLFLNDKIFVKALFNMVAFSIAISFLFVFVFALIIFFYEKKIKTARWVFYLGSVFIGGLTTLIYTSYLSITFPLTTSNFYAAQIYYAQMIISHTNVLFSLYIGILTAFVFWILELIFDIIKNLRRTRNMK